MTIRKVEQDYKLRKIGRAASETSLDIPPAGLAPALRASWSFARKMAQQFNQELMHERKDRVKEFLKNLVKRFV